MPPSPESAPVSVRPRATVLGAFVEGWRRVLRAPALTIGLLVLTLLTALPLAAALDTQMRAYFGSSLEADTALAGWDEPWAAGFHAASEGVGRTFGGDVLGFGGTLAIASRVMDARPLDRSIVAAVAVYILSWVFLTGGILDRLARGRRVGAAAFFSACGAYFLRFLRLAPLVAAAYWVLFRWLHPLLFTTLGARLAGDLTGHQAVVLRSLLYVVFFACLAAVVLVADFIKVRFVVEDRRSVIGATAAAMRFVRRRAWRVAGLAVLNGVAALIIARLWLQVAPGASAANWLVLGLGQLYIVARLWARLAFMASEVVFFQGELAHARYAARPMPGWADSSAVEAVRDLRG
jgi:hypothetical protein